MDWVETQSLTDAGTVPYLAIADRIERDIRSGRLRPNERLPTTVELSRVFGVTVPTVQKGLSRLAARGLLNRAPRRGTFVSSCIGADTIALAVGQSPYASESAFPRLIIDSFHRLCGAYNASVSVHILSDQDGPQNAARLEQDVHDGRVKCIFSFFHSTFQSHWLEGLRDVPWVTVFDIGFRHMVKTGVSHLLAHGRRDIRVLSMLPPDKDAALEREGATEAFAAAGVPPPPGFLIQCGQREQHGYEATHQLLSGRQRPDGLLVNHDLLTRGVLLALAERGARVPQDLALISHENKGSEILAPFPLTVIRVEPDRIVNVVLERICHGPALRPGENAVRLDLAPTLIPRGSCGETVPRNGAKRDRQSRKPVRRPGTARRHEGPPAP
ncbi:MAG: hypothetical protein A3K19_01645 [Lentisphaerae bacterium RIFOXYB12_FULL_65_16]|nr:MAG: hypothetical protein A3K18_02820 [Lentisphaerae bacterium RIFOXYA12_64_32]OGV92854.1 MAG: hypothetical protein A3K19_01645 [Lentisphaerae bacterium RIFOXYB12_FULL_65_16]